MMTELQAYRSVAHVLMVISIVLVLGVIFIGRRLEAERVLRRQAIDNLEAALGSR